MSVEASAWAYKQVHLKHPEKNVLNALAWRHYAPTGLCNPGLERLMQDTGVTSKETVKKGIRHLEGLGLIAVKKERAASGKMKANSYTLHIGVMVTEEQAREFYGDRPKRVTGLTKRNDKLKAKRAADRANAAVCTGMLKGFNRIDDGIAERCNRRIDTPRQSYAIAPESEHSEGINQSYAVEEPELCGDVTRAMACAEPGLSDSTNKCSPHRLSHTSRAKGSQAVQPAAQLSAHHGRASSSQQGEKGVALSAEPASPALAVAATNGVCQGKATPLGQDASCWPAGERWPRDEDGTPLPF